MGSWNLGTISGIKIRLHWSFLILPVWIYFSSILAGGGMIAALSTLLFVLAVFGCVLLHELGHALAARQFGIGTRDITLLPIGGVAILERMPRNPMQELWITVAGPLVNAVIASLLFIGLAVSPFAATSALTVFFTKLAIGNVVLVVFNMLPAFPMDGGRVLRSVLAMRMEWNAATRIAVGVGQLTSVALGLFGVFSANLMLVLVGAFIYYAAEAERLAVTESTSPQSDPRHAFPPKDHFSEPEESPFSVFYDSKPNSFDRADEGIWFGRENVAECKVPASLPANSVAAWLANCRAEYCKVVDSGREIGTVTKSQLLSALAQGFGNRPVGQLLG